MLSFEFDLEKSQKNLEKHGIDFLEAQKLWQDLEATQVQARSETEIRYALIAQKEGVFWTAFYTLRSSTVRLISVRRSRKKEKEVYYESGRAR